MMAQYQCGTCGFFKNSNQLTHHLVFRHNVHLILGPTYIRKRGNYCEDCNLQFRSCIQALKHLDTVHHIHVSYIRGIAKKRIFMDGL